MARQNERDLHHPWVIARVNGEILTPTAKLGKSSLITVPIYLFMEMLSLLYRLSCLVTQVIKWHLVYGEKLNIIAYTILF